MSVLFIFNDLTSSLYCPCDIEHGYEDTIPFKEFWEVYYEIDDTKAYVRYYARDIKHIMITL